jgi:flagellar secretion chaperone FliS
MYKLLEAEVETADRLELLLMLYEGCFRFMNSAIIAIDNKNIPEFCENLLKAIDIVVELTNSLNFEVGSDLPHLLAKVYRSVLYFLTEANLKRRKDEIIIARNCLQKIYEGFKQIDSQNRKPS